MKSWIERYEELQRLEKAYIEAVKNGDEYTAFCIEKRYEEVSQEPVDFCGVILTVQ